MRKEREVPPAAFSSPSQLQLYGGGITYGAAYQQNLTVAHSAAADTDSCLKQQGSKYVQSDISECFADIKEKLENQTRVLFTGTPCQVAAVKNYCLQKKISTDNLLLVEILCYGVPSPQIWADYIRHLKDRYGQPKEYCFRDERDGWSNIYCHRAVFQDGTELYKTKELQAFGSLFGSRVNMRESCFSCKFDSFYRCADITIGDCWGIEHINKEFSDAYGISQVLINTEKGKAFWNTVKDCFETVPADIEKISQYNSVLSRPAARPDEYEKFWADYNRHGFDYIMKRYTRMGKTFRIRKKMKALRKKFF